MAKGVPQILHEFIKQSPPGEERDVLNDLKTIVDPSQFDEKQVEASLSELSREHFCSYKVKENTSLTTEHNHLSDCWYFDPRYDMKFKVSHSTKECISKESHTADSFLSSIRLIMQDKVQDYVTNHFPTGGFLIVPKSEDTFVLCIQSNSFQPKNLLFGLLTTEWTIKFSGKIEISGSKNVKTHYFEQGNVQMFVKQRFSHEIERTDDDSKDCTKIMTYIKRTDEEYQTKIVDEITTIGDASLKAFRRALPITKSLIDWEKLLLRCGVDGTLPFKF